MGEVYRATDTKLGREVALKVLPAEVASDRDRLERFRREAKALAALDHPGIVTVYSVEEADGVHFLTMQLVEGQPLDKLIPGGGMPLARLLAIATALAEALAAAHEKGIVHRDLKPANVMVTSDGGVKILDFGLAKLGAQAGEAGESQLSTAVQTRAGVVMGTMPYMSPEQLEGHAVDHRTDIFSLGVLLYEMATGRRPFQAESTAGLISAILKETAAPVSTVRAGLPRGLERIVGRCLEKRAADRYSSTRELLGRLQELKGEVATGSVGRPIAESRVPRTLKVALGMAAALVVATALLLVLGRRPGSSPTGEEPTTSAGPPAVASPAASVDRSIAVLPFANLSGDPEQEYFGDGIAEEVLNALSGVADLRVAARTSAFSFKGKNLDVRTIGERLQVAHVLEGSVRKAGDRVRITAQLVNAKDGYRVWSESFDRELTDIFAVQEEIAQAIVRALNAQLAVESAERHLVQPGTDNLNAYNAYLRGRFHLGTYSREATKQSIRDFEQAIAADPGFADGWGALTMAYANLHVWEPFAEVERRLREAFEKALRLDPEQPGGLVGKAWYTVYQTWDWRGAEGLYVRALQHGRQDSFAVDFYAALQLSPTGRTDAAAAVYRRALESDPFNTILGFDLAWVLMIGGRPEAARAEIDKVLATTPDYAWGLGLKAWALSESGSPEELRAAVARPAESDDELVLMTLIQARQALGEADAVERLTERLRRLARSSPVHSFYLGWSLVATGRVDEGLSELERALDLGAFQVPFLRPALGRIPSVWVHPRFQALLRRMKLDDASLREQGFVVPEAER